MIKTAAALLFVGLNFYIYHYLATEEVIHERAQFDEFPLEIGDWLQESHRLAKDVAYHPDILAAVRTVEANGGELEKIELPD